MVRIGVVILALLVAATISSSQSDACMNNCAVSCAQTCQSSADPNTCGYNCGVNCVQQCGGNLNTGIGITNPDQCAGVTTPDGYPTVLYAGNCVDPDAAQHYCQKAATCNDCQNSNAYPCIWDGACVACTSGDCIISCGGNGANNGNQNGGSNNNNGGNNNGGNNAQENNTSPGGPGDNGNNGYQPNGGCLRIRLRHPASRGRGLNRQKPGLQ